MFLRHFRALLRKNVLLLSSAKVRLAFILLAPLFGVLMIQLMYKGSTGFLDSRAGFDINWTMSMVWWANKTVYTWLYNHFSREEVEAVNGMMKILADQILTGEIQFYTDSKHGERCGCLWGLFNSSTGCFSCVDVLYNMTSFGGNTFLQTSKIRAAMGQAIALKLGRH